MYTCMVYGFKVSLGRAGVLVPQFIYNNKTLHTTVHQSQLAGRENPHTLTDTHMHTYNHTCPHTHPLTHTHMHTHITIYISLQRIPHVWTTCSFHTMWSPSSPTRILRRLPWQSCNSIYPQWRLAWMSSLLRSSKYCRRPCTDHTAKNNSQM